MFPFPTQIQSWPSVLMFESHMTTSKFADGSASSPSYSFINETNSGLYRAGLNDLRISIAGSDRFKITAAGIIAVGNISPDATGTRSLGDTTKRFRAVALGGTETGSNAPAIDASQTWNNAGTVFTAAQVNAVDTASSAASLLLDLQLGGTSVFSVAKSGFVNIQGSVAEVSMTQFSADTVPTQFIGKKARGTISSPGQVLANDQLLALFGKSYTSAGAFAGNNIVAMSMFAAEDQTAANQGTYIVFGTTALGATSRSERVRITAGGLIAIGGATASFPALKQSSSVLQVRLADDSAYAALDALSIKASGTKVVGSQVTGWGAASGTLSRAAFDSGTITSATVAQVLAALVTDLRSHGLIGT